ncbi:MAG: GH116 family glycosyl hydrolase, partial [Phycisphaerae bacterium]
ELFARTLADTSLGSPLAFSWSSHLSTAVTNTWWVKDGNYSIWEGLGCCGQSTMDVEYDGSFSIVALFPDLKLAQMQNMLKYQNAQGQVPHTYDGDFTHIDQSGWGRVDMNPQFVMMVYRDYLWTGDKKYLKDMWPHVVKAMQYTGSLDTNGDGLPDKDTRFQTYDQWGLRGSPSYICSLWIGALQAAIKMAIALGHRSEVAPWEQTLAKAAESFDRMLFNGQYYSLWVDGTKRDEVCMADQISGQWFSHLIGLPTAISRQHLASALHSILKYNFNPETGLRNASVPHGKRHLLILDNLQAGGVWSGVEYAFASCLMDYGHYADGAELVAAVNRRYLRAGMPWNHVECGDHYSRPMSSWATLLAATGFKPDVPRQTLALTPSVPGDFHAPWVTKEGFGHISRVGKTIVIRCASGQISCKILRVNLPTVQRGVVIAGQKPAQQVTHDGEVTVITLSGTGRLAAGQVMVIS